MSEPYDELEGYEAAEAEDPVYEELSPEAAWEEAYYASPIQAINYAVAEAARDVAQQVADRNEQYALQLQAQQQTEVVRQAMDAMAEKYGKTWADDVPSVLDAMKYDAARGAVPYHDAQALALHTERAFLAERERTRPTDEQIEQETWARIKANRDPVSEYTEGIG